MHDIFNYFEGGQLANHNELIGISVILNETL